MPDGPADLSAKAELNPETAQTVRRVDTAYPWQPTAWPGEVQHSRGGGN